MWLKLCVNPGSLWELRSDHFKYSLFSRYVPYFKISKKKLIVSFILKVFENRITFWGRENIQQMQNIFLQVDEINRNLNPKDLVFHPMCLKFFSITNLCTSLQVGSNLFFLYFLWKYFLLNSFSTLHKRHISDLQSSILLALNRH